MNMEKSCSSIHHFHNRQTKYIDLCHRSSIIPTPRKYDRNVDIWPTYPRASTHAGILLEIGFSLKAMYVDTDFDMFSSY